MRGYGYQTTTDQDTKMLVEMPEPRIYSFMSWRGTKECSQC